MCNRIYEDLIVCLGDLLRFPVSEGREKLLDCGLLKKISTQGDAMATNWKVGQIEIKGFYLYLK